MKDTKKSIKFRLISRVILLILIVFIFISMVFDFLISQYMKNNANEVLHNSRDYIVQGPMDSGSEPQIPHKPKPNGTPMGKAETVVLTSNYVILHPTQSLDKYFDNRDLQDFTIEIKAQKINLDTSEIQKLSTDSGLYYFTSISKSDMDLDQFYIVNFINMSHMNEFKVNLSRILWIIMILALLTTVLMTYVIGSRITEPIVYLSEFAKKIGEGKYETIEDEFDDLELHHLKNPMNDTSKKLKAYDAEQRAFFQNVSHELRTPLQIIKTNAEGIQFDILEKNSACVIIKDETDKLSELVEDIIYLSRLESRSKDMITTQNDLRETLSYAAERYHSLFTSKNIKVSYEFDEDPVLFTYDEKSIERAFQNLLSNALRYSRGKIIITCRKTQGRIVIKVEDNGPGISQEDLPRIFDRFYKGENGVHGIGLSIVKSIVTSYGGRVEVQSSLKGTAFTIFFN
ncbi:signal transduction histidine kinase [Alkalibaculum bacchi]|uniref:histidine kinase n=1 Tax=Alkalibaculum bacchi TaxID=645887 RepID=A0A366IC98_9FIRM|nr:HAMP domain-containing sensor histidine kinase [Alkalibaculum bacchi]RBP66695.1 signal transduction histidine kinase [Alkalibaculum bacchi]